MKRENGASRADYYGDGCQFVERSRKMSETGKRINGTYSSPRHKIYNTFVWLNGDKAVAEMQCMMGAYHMIDGVEYHRFGWARLLYKVAKEDGIWKVDGLDFIYERDMMTPGRTDCVDERFDKMARAWEDDEVDGNDEIPELYFCNPAPNAKRDPLPDFQIFPMLVKVK